MHIYSQRNHGSLKFLHCKILFDLKENFRAVKKPEILTVIERELFTQKPAQNLPIFIIASISLRRNSDFRIISEQSISVRKYFATLFLHLPL